MKLLSIVGFAAILLAIFCLWQLGALFSRSPWVTVSPVTATLLLVWARLIFGWRSFHAAADPTAGGLVTTGPYRFVRHPIYAAICLFVGAGALGKPSPQSVSLGVPATAGVIVRLSCEERLVAGRYPEDREYSLATKRLLPGVW